MKSVHLVKFGGLMLSLFLIFAGNYLQAADDLPAYERLSPGQVALLSLIPGEGQFYNQQTKKGWFFLSSEVAVLTAAAFSASAEQNAWRTSRLSDTAEERNFYQTQYRQHQLNKRSLIYLLVFIKGMAALDAYVDANFYAIDHRVAKVSMQLNRSRINISTVFFW